MDNIQTNEKSWEELARIERCGVVVAKTMHPYLEMQDFFDGISCSNNHAVTYSTRYAYVWGVDACTGRLGHDAEGLNIGNEDNHDKKKMFGDHKNDEQGRDTKSPEKKEVTSSKKVDQPKVVKFLSNIFNKNNQKLNMQMQEDNFNDNESGKTKKSGRSKKSNTKTERNSVRSKTTTKERKLGTSSMTSLMEVDSEDGENHVDTVEKFIEMIKQSEKDNIYQELLGKARRMEDTCDKAYKLYGQLKKLNSFSEQEEKL